MTYPIPSYPLRALRLPQDLLRLNVVVVHASRTRSQKIPVTEIPWETHGQSMGNPQKNGIFCW